MKACALSACALALLVGACATRGPYVEAVHVDEAIYADWTCEQINKELVFVTDRATLLAGSQEARRQTLFLGNQLVPLLSQVKGQREALVRISEQKGCVVGAGTGQ